MKKIISNRTYNTETATEKGCKSYSTPGDLNYLCETLYQKKSGEFFLYGVGGAMTKYAVATGPNEWSGGEKIIPLTYDAAQKWAEENLTGDRYEEIFGAVPEDDTKTTMLISLTVSEAETIRRHASAAGISVSEYIRGLIK